MIAWLISWSLRRRGLVLAVALGLFIAGGLYVRSMPVDAIPDLSDTQVIIYTTWMGRSPDLVEDQITYPIVTALLSAPRVTVVRGFSDFGFSYVYVLFKDGTDIYWARSRVLEYMNQLAGRLPEALQNDPLGRIPLPEWLEDQRPALTQTIRDRVQEFTQLRL